ncbi:MAG: YeeE/YedE family protein, partial [Sneathiella sp.]|nr:YeeE/YedE family protein [Sneathiella sp.]
ASFGFSAAYRRLFRHGDTRGVDGQIILLAATMLLFAPALSLGTVFGNSVGGAIAPVGLGMAFGAFVFGIGMQIGGSCASGTLFTVGSGNPRMMIVLVFFCLGAFWGSLDLAWWQSLPGLGTVSFSERWGWDVVLPVQLLVLLALYLGLGRLRRRTAENRETPATVPLGRRLLRGPWPFVWGGISLAFLNWVTLVTAGHPWSITWGFTLWGAKIATLAGWDPATSGFWTGGFQQQALNGFIWQDVTSVMNIGIIGGAFLAMILAKRVTSSWDKRWRPILAAVIGGLMLGYGARLAYGCNIGAFISGAASGSLHGWVWILCALPGNWIGMHLRRLFQLEP